VTMFDNLAASENKKIFTEVSSIDKSKVAICATAQQSKFSLNALMQRS
jgi:hypothetical protein